MLLLAAAALVLAVCTPGTHASSDHTLQQVVERLQVQDRLVQHLQVQVDEQARELALLKEHQRTNTGVAFTVRRNGDTSLAGGAKVPFNAVIENAGNGYDSTSYQFVAPHTGLYVFYYNIHLYSGSARFSLYRDDALVVDGYAKDDAMADNVAVLQLTAGDRVDVRSNTSSGVKGSASHTTFSGFSL